MGLWANQGAIRAKEKFTCDLFTFPIAQVHLIPDHRKMFDVVLSPTLQTA